MKPRDLNFYLMRGALKAVALLPLPVLYLISDAICFVLRRVLHYRRAVIRDNLSSAFPEKPACDLLLIENEFYRHLSDLMVETIKLLHISDRTLDRHIEVVNGHLIDELAQEGRPLILFMGHYGNWEWVPDVARFYSPDIKSYHIYKPLRDQISDRLYEEEIRTRFSSRGIPQGLAVRQILKLKSESPKFMVGFIADQRSNSDVIHNRVEFLNHLTPYNVGGETIGDKIKAIYVYLDVEKPRRGHYRMTFKRLDPADDGQPYPYTREYYRLLEATIRRQPPYWLWSHRRWLYK